MLVRSRHCEQILYQSIIINLSNFEKAAAGSNSEERKLTWEAPIAGSSFGRGRERNLKKFRKIDPGLRRGLCSALLDWLKASWILSQFLENSSHEMALLGALKMMQRAVFG